MLLGTLVTSLIGNILADKGAIAKGISRADEDTSQARMLARIFNITLCFNKF